MSECGDSDRKGWQAGWCIIDQHSMAVRSLPSYTYDPARMSLYVQLPQYVCRVAQQRGGRGSGSRVMGMHLWLSSQYKQWGLPAGWKEAKLSKAQQIGCDVPH